MRKEGMATKNKKPLISVTTKTGDKGTTSLANGERLPKSDQLFEVIGTLDELNSWLGMIVAEMENQFAMERDFLLYTQHTLFEIGAELAQSPTTKLDDKFLAEVETRTDHLQSQMAADWVMKFRLPGGTKLAATIDVSRTVCRRLERLVIHFSEDHKVRSAVQKTINRYSDYLFVLRCYVNHQLDYQEHIFHHDSKYLRKVKQAVQPHIK